MTTPTLERVWVAVGYPADPAAKDVPVTIFDKRSRRCTYVKRSRAELAPMGESKTAEWTAYWSAGAWRLVDVVRDVGAAA